MSELAPRGLGVLGLRLKNFVLGDVRELLGGLMLAE